MKPDVPMTTSSSPAETTRNGAGTGSRLSLRFSKKQLALAFAIAALSDVIGTFVALAPPLVWTVDVLTVVMLFAVLGWQRLLLPGLLMEAIPGLGVFPFWLLVVGGIAAWGTARPKIWPISAPGPRS